MYVSLYRRYRPQSFSDVVGQSAAIGVVTRAIETGAVSHAYLFSGPRGCGKTTVARLFAKAVNCPQRKGAEPCNECETCRSIVEGSCLDVIEIDGASNNSVDEIRDLKEHVALASFSCAYKIYIIDEVHMLSMSAFNALLKTLEEPPERVVFILATTAPHKVPVTIRSRCQHIPFHGMTPEQIVDRLRHISELERIQSQDEALWEIARNSEGGMRDALSLMEQAIALSSGDVTREAVDKLLGGGSSSSIRQWISRCRQAPEEALSFLEGLFRSGAVPERFLSMLFVCVRNLWLQSRWGDKVLKNLMLSEEERRWLQSEKDHLSREQLERLMAQLASALPQVRRGLSNDVLCGLLVEWMMREETLPAEMPSAGASVSSPGRPSPEAVGASFREARLDSFPIPEPEARRSDPAAPEVKRPLAAAPEAPATQPRKIAAEPGAASEKPAGADLSQADRSVPVDGELKDLMMSSIGEVPQAAVPLCLADVLSDAEKETVYVLFDESERMAYEALRNDRAIEAARRMFQQCDIPVKTVELRCGSERQVFQGFLSDDAEGPVEAEPAKDPAARGSAGGSDGAAPSVSRRDMSRFDPEAFVAGLSVPEAVETLKEEKKGSLVEFVRGLMEGEVLYCRPHEQAGDAENEDESS